MPDCLNCQHNYFCCRLRVKLTFWERLRILLGGHRNFAETDALGRKIICFKDNQCFFLENNRCKIYAIRPKPCRDFPFGQNCGEAYNNIMKIRRTSLKL